MSSNLFIEFLDKLARFLASEICRRERYVPFGKLSMSVTLLHGLQYLSKAYNQYLYTVFSNFTGIYFELSGSYRRFVL